VPLGPPETLKNYKFEAIRLYSFLTLEGLSFKVSVFELARCGFYYAGSEDYSRCVFCQLEVRGWEEDDTVEGEHRRWNPTCPFLVNPKDVGNVPIGQEDTALGTTENIQLNTFNNRGQLSLCKNL